MIGNHLDALSTYLDLHSTTYEKILNRGAAYENFLR